MLSTVTKNFKKTIIIDKKTYVVDDVGMSGNQVLIFEDMVLKIEDSSVSMIEQVQMMQWLQGKILIELFKDWVFIFPSKYGIITLS